MNGALESAGEVDSYTVAAAAGEVIRLRADKTSGTSDPYLEVIDPTGATVAQNWNEINATLTAAGAYVVRVRDGFNTRTGTYNLVFQRLKNPCGASALSCGQLASGTIAAASEMHMRTLTVAAGEVIRLRADKTSGVADPYLELFDPSGTRVAQNWNEINTTLSTAGAYALLVRDGYNWRTGAYNLTFQRLKNPCNAAALLCGQLVSGTVAGASEMHLRSLSVAAGEVVRLRADKTSGISDPYLELFDPAGVKVAENWNEINTTLAAAGAYSLLVRDGYNWRTGAYNLTFQRLKTPCNATTLSCGQLVSGTVAGTSEIHLRTITVAAGEVIRLRADKTSGISDPYLELFDPAGVRVTQNWNEINTTLASAGTYTVLLRDGYNWRTGTYNLTFQRLKNPCNATPLACGKLISGNLTGASAMQLQTISVAAGEVVRLRADKTSGTADPYLELLDPAGVGVAQNWNEINATLTTAGTYTLLLRDGYNWRTGGYNVTFQRLKNPCNATSLACGQVASAAIGSASEMQMRTFDVVAGEIVRLRSDKVGGASDPYLELFDPAGVRVAQNWNEINATLASAGTYTLLMRDGYYWRTGSYGITLQRLKNPCAPVLGCGQTVQSFVVRPSDIEAFIINVTASDPMLFQITNVTGTLQPLAEILDSSGRQVATFQNQIQFTAPIGGPYLLLIRDYFYGRTGGFAIRWQRQAGPCLTPGQLLITNVTPDRGGDTGPVTVQVYGGGFLQGASVKLSRSGFSDIVGIIPTVADSGTKISATFDLSRKAQGTWTIVTTHPSEGSATMPNSFSIEPGTASQLWVDIVGPQAIRPGREARFWVTYGNSGNVDTHDLVLRVSLPKDFQVFADLPHVDDARIDWGSIPIGSTVGNEYVIPVWLLRLAAQSQDGFELRVRAPVASIGQSVRIHAELAQVESLFAKSGNSADIEISPTFAALSSSLRETLTNVSTSPPSDALVRSALRDAIDMLWRNHVPKYAAIWAGVGAILGTVLFSPPLGTLIGGTIGITVGAMVDQALTLWDFLMDIHFDAIDALNSVTADAFSQVVGAIDPNEKTGSKGSGALGYVSLARAMHYGIQFENLATATAAAQEVVVVDRLDPSELDFTSLSLGAISFGKWRVVPPEGANSYRTVVDLRSDKNLLVEVDARFDVLSGVLTWRFTSVDPATGQLPDDPLAGFLPPNRTPPEGDGSVLFTVMPKAGLPTGTQIRNRASIVFDTNAPVETPEWVNTIDSTKPTSQVAALSPSQGPSFTLQWSGSDQHSGIQSYAIYVSENSGAFTPWLTTTQTSATFNGACGRTYAFYSLARDNAGNVEDPPAQRDAVTSVQTCPSLSVNPATLQFNYALGSALPAPQTVSTASATAIPFNASATTTSGGPWLAVQPSSGTTGTNLSISLISPPTIAGSYSGTIAVSAPGASNSPRNVTVNLVVSGVAPRYTLGLQAAPANAGSITANPAPSNGYSAGARVCLTATPAAGWVFQSWSGSPLDAAGCLTMDANKSVTANFVAGPGACVYSIGPGNVIAPVTGLTGATSVTAGAGCAWTAVSTANWITVTAGASGSGPGTIGYSVAPNSGAARIGTIAVSGQSFTVSQAPAGLHFVPVVPCRLVDTREGLGPFGKPPLAAGETRSFALPAATCGIPATASAYALNVTVVPKGPLGYITLWAAGQPQPYVSTLNSVDGRIKANAALVPAGTNGGISVFATDATELVLDINGYFVPPGAAVSGLAFYPLAPCRVLDTRLAAGPLGGPILSSGVERSFPVRSSNCGVPPTALAYSINATVVPAEPLGYLTLWPTGENRPHVSTLNAPTGTIVANAAIIRAGTGGAMSAYATNPTHLVVDINGYFAPPGAANAQRFFAITPCRVSDTRTSAGPLGGPVLGTGQSRAWPILQRAECVWPPSPGAYSLNATVIPQTILGYLTMWPAGGSPPFVSTLNAFDDRVVANGLIVPAGVAGSVSSFVTNQTDLVIDANGYF